MMNNRIRLFNLYKNQSIHKINTTCINSIPSSIKFYTTNSNTTTATATTTTTTTTEDAIKTIPTTTNIDVKPYIQKFKKQIELYNVDSGSLLSDVLNEIKLNKFNNNSELMTKRLSQIIGMKKIDFNDSVIKEIIKKQNKNTNVLPIVVYLSTIENEKNNKKTKVKEMIQNFQDSLQSNDSDISSGDIQQYICNLIKQSWYSKLIATLIVKLENHNGISDELLDEFSEYINDEEFQELLKFRKSFIPELMLSITENQFKSIVNQVKEEGSIDNIFSQESILSNIYSNLKDKKSNDASSYWFELMIKLGYPIEEHIYLDVLGSTKEFERLNNRILNLGYETPKDKSEEQKFSKLVRYATYESVYDYYFNKISKPTDQINQVMGKYLIKSMIENKFHLQMIYINDHGNNDAINRLKESFSEKKQHLYKFMESSNLQESSTNTFNLILKTLVESYKKPSGGSSGNWRVFTFENVLAKLRRSNNIINLETIDILSEFYSITKRKGLLSVLKEFSKSVTLSETENINLLIKIAIHNDNKSEAMELLSELYKKNLKVYKSTMSALISNDPLNPAWINLYKQQQQEQDGEELINSYSFGSITNPVDYYKLLKDNEIEIKDETLIYLVNELVRIGKFELVEELLLNIGSINPSVLIRILRNEKLPISREDFDQLEPILTSDPNHRDFRLNFLSKISMQRGYYELSEKYVKQIKDDSSNILKDFLIYCILISSRLSKLQKLKPSQNKEEIENLKIEIENQQEKLIQSIESVTGSNGSLQNISNSNKHSILLAFYHSTNGLYNHVLASSDNGKPDLSSSLYLKIRSELFESTTSALSSIRKPDLDLIVLDRMILQSFNLESKYYSKSKIQSNWLENQWPRLSIDQVQKYLISKIKSLSNNIPLNSDENNPQLLEYRGEVNNLLSKFEKFSNLVRFKKNVEQFSELFNHFINNPNHFKFIENSQFLECCLEFKDTPMIQHQVFLFKYYLNQHQNEKLFIKSFNSYFNSITSRLIQHQLIQQFIKNQPLVDQFYNLISSGKIVLAALDNILKVSTISNSPLNINFSLNLLNKIIEGKFKITKSILNSKNLLFAGGIDIENGQIDKELLEKVDSYYNDFKNQDIEDNSVSTGILEVITVNENTDDGYYLTKIKEILVSKPYDNLNQLIDPIYRGKVKLSLDDKSRLYIMVNSTGIIPNGFQRNRVNHILSIEYPPAAFSSNHITFQMSEIKKYNELFTRVLTSFERSVSPTQLFSKYDPEIGAFGLRVDNEQDESLLFFNVAKYNQLNRNEINKKKEIIY